MTRLDWLFWLSGGLLAAGGVALLAWAMLWDRARGKKRCPRCWYDMSAAPAVAFDIRTREGQVFRCPECGRTIAEDRAVRRTPRRWRWALAGTASLLAGIMVGVGRDVLTGRVLGYAPRPIVGLALTACGSQAEAAYANLAGGPSTIQQTSTRWRRLLIARHIAVRLRESAQVGSWIETLDALGEDAWPAMPSLLARSTRADRRDAWRIVGAIGRIAPEPMRALVQVVNVGSEWARLAAAREIERIGPDARRSALAPMIRAMEEDPSGAVRLACARAVRRLAPLRLDPGVAGAFARAIDDPDAEVRVFAARTLGHRHDWCALFIGSVMRRARVEADDRVRFLLVMAAAHAAPATPEGVEAVVQLLKDPQISTRIWAVQTLGWWGPASGEAADAIRAARDADPDMLGPAAEESLRAIEGSSRAKGPDTVEAPR